MKRFKTALILLLIFALSLSIYACGKDVKEVVEGKDAYLERLDEINEKVYDSVVVTGNYYDELINLELPFDSKLNGYTVDGVDLEVERISNTHANYFKDYDESDDILFQTGDLFTIQVSIEIGNEMYMFDENGNITLYSLTLSDGSTSVSLTFQYK